MCVRISLRSGLFPVLKRVCTLNESLDQAGLFTSEARVTIFISGGEQVLGGLGTKNYGIFLAFSSKA